MQSLAKRWQPQCNRAKRNAQCRGRAGLSEEPPRHLQSAQVVSFLAQMPREDTGKIFKRKLREPYWAGADRRI